MPIDHHRRVVPLSLRIHVGLAAFFCALLATTLVRAEEHCEERRESLAMQAAMTPASSPAERAPMTPCQRARDAGNYNFCFEGNPFPLSTMPEWLAKWQAEEAVATVFAQVNLIHAEVLTASVAPAPLALEAPRWWLSEVMERVQSTALAPGEGDICLEGFEESCESMPPVAAVMLSGKIPPTLVEEEAGEYLRPSAERRVTQRPQDHLRVGPALLALAPERPPPRG